MSGTAGTNTNTVLDEVDDVLSPILDGVKLTNTLLNFDTKLKMPPDSTPKPIDSILSFNFSLKNSM